MKCFLHIGTEKTATTTIQSFLKINRQALSDHGYLYPKTVGLANQSKLAIAAYDLDKRDDLTAPLNLHTNTQLANYQQQIIESLKAEIDRTQPAHIIFSSEHLQSRLTRLSEINRLKTILKQIGCDQITVIVYLRNPTELATSLYSTFIKGGSLMAHPPAPGETSINGLHFSHVCNHRATLERFSDVFGQSALIPRLFSRNELKNGSIIDDILAVIGLSQTDHYQVPDNKNEALSAVGVEIMRRLNPKLSQLVDHHPNSLRHYLAGYLGTYFDTSNKYVMPENLYQQYQAAFRENNEWVRRYYFPKRQTLFPMKPYPGEPDIAMTSEQLDWVADMVGTAWIEAHISQSAIKRWGMKISLRGIAKLAQLPWLMALPCHLP